MSPQPSSRPCELEDGPRSRHSSMVELHPPPPQYRHNVQPFAGRVGGNQAFILDHADALDTDVLKKEPDAAPHMSLRELLDCRPFATKSLWKAAVIEGIGTLMFVYITVWASASPRRIPVKPNAQLGNFDNAAFLGPLVGSLVTMSVLSLLITSFGPVSGAHFNPLVTIATFFARLCSLPRMVLYVSFQIAGASLAGLLVRASYGTRDFQVGGCFLYPEAIPVQDAFVIELVTATFLLFLAFGVGLDPRQAQVIGSGLAPFLVGLVVGTLSLATSFTRYGYGGAGLNPARCFGVFVGSSFPSWHWVHWVPDILACMIHGFVYFMVPPWDKISTDQA